MAFLVLMSAALGQEKPGGRGPVFRGPMFGGAIEILRTGRMRDEVRKDLAISEDQAKKIEEAFKPLNELRGDFMEAQNLAPEDRQKRMKEIFEKGAAESKLAEARLNEIFNAEQRARFKQLWLQAQGAAAFIQPETADELGLSSEQRDKMRQIAASVRPQLGDHKLQDLSQQERQQLFADLNARRDKAQLEMLAVLTSEQKAKLAEMKGKALPFPPQRLGSSSDRPGGARRQPATKE